MKHINQLMAAFLLLLSYSMMSSAVEPTNKPEPQGMGGGMGGMMGGGMGGGMGGMTEEQRDQHIRSMQEHMLQMHDLSSQILNEKDPAKKENLKKQQFDLIKAHHNQMMEHRQQLRQEHQKMMQPEPKTKQ
jgi:Spy/CpxP family protein refolding chaperone